MISVTYVLGNIKREEKFRETYEAMCRKDECEKVVISRIESQRARIRKATDKGTDIGLTLQQGYTIRDGDVLYQTNDKMIVAEIEPENVAVLAFKQEDMADNELFEVAVKIGHALGNLHRPIRVEGAKVFLPIQADTEIELLNKIFTPFIDHLTITRTKMVFEADEGLHTHEH